MSERRTASGNMTAKLLDAFPKGLRVVKKKKKKKIVLEMVHMLFLSSHTAWQWSWLIFEVIVTQTV